MEYYIHRCIIHVKSPRSTGSHDKPEVIETSAVIGQLSELVVAESSTRQPARDWRW